MNKALVTGGAGFIGSHLASDLLERGWAVEIVDDLSTGREENVADLKGNPRFSVVEGSVMDRHLMHDLIDRADVVFHLAAAVGVQLIVEQPVRTIESNIRGTELILELSSLNGTPVLLTSTSEIYGKLDHAEFDEEDDMVLGPTSRARWCYAASKIIDEFLAIAYYKEQRLPTIIVRLFNTVGPRQTGQYGMVVPRFVRQTLAGEPITVYGDGTQRRSFTWISDVVGSMIALIGRPEAYGKVFNIGHTEEISIYDLAVMVKELTGSDSGIEFIPYEQAYEPGFEDINRRLPNLAKIRALIGYEPSMNLPAMLKKIIVYERARLTPAGPRA